MAGMRESTSLLMAAAENGHAIQEHSWVAAPPSRRAVEMDKRKKNVMFLALAVLLTVSIVAVAFLFFFPSKNSGHDSDRRQNLELEMFQKVDRKLGERKRATEMGTLDREFLPSADMDVSVGGLPVKYGHQMESSLMVSVPSVFNFGHVDDLHTLAMVEVGSVKNFWGLTSKKEYLHWMVVNIPGNADASEGQTMVHFEPQATQWESIRKYMLVLFKQDETIATGGTENWEREDFEILESAKTLRLGNPLAVLQFETLSDSTNDDAPRGITSVTM